MFSFSFAALVSVGVATTLLSGLIGGRLRVALASRMFAMELQHYDGAAGNIALEQAFPFTRKRYVWKVPLPFIHGVASMTAAMILVFVLPIPEDIPDVYVLGFFVVIIDVLIMLVELHLARIAIIRVLRERLIAEGTIVCRRCGYDLRGQIEQRCPECGNPFSLTPENASTRGQSGPPPMEDTRQTKGGVSRDDHCH